MNRRAFLGVGLGALAWACGRGERAAGPASPSPAQQAFSVVLTADPNNAGAVGDSRLAFAMISGGRPVAPDGVRARLVPPDGAPVPVEVRKQEIRLGVGGDEDHEHAEGTEVQTIFVATHPLDTPGIWTVEVVAAEQGSRAVFNIVESSPVPAVGQPGISVPSPTVADPRGVDPICTRRPPCPMHETSIDDSLRSPRPSIIVFATPLYCRSRTCGPVVDILEAVREELGEQADFIHVEVWKSPDVVDRGPEATVDAFRAWNLPSEPYLFFVGADGVVRERWVGAVGLEETAEAARALVAGEL